MFCCDVQASFDTSKELVMGRGGVRRIAEAAKSEPKDTQGAVLDPCVLARVKLSLAPNETKTVSFALAPGGRI